MDGCVDHISDPLRYRDQYSFSVPMENRWMEEIVVDLQEDRHTGMTSCMKETAFVRSSRASSSLYRRRLGSHRCHLLHVTLTKRGDERTR